MARRVSLIKHNWLGKTFLVAAVFFVAVATLVPTPVRETTRLACLWCDQRALADAFLNVVLFAPFGAALALLGITPLRATLAGVVLSGLIELAQVDLIPGRDAALTDLVTNAVGTLLGASLVASAPWWLRPTPRRAGLLALGAAAFTTAMVGLPAWLLQPAYPAGVPYYGQWTPRLRHLEWYNGHVLDAHIGEMAVRPQRLRANSVRALLAAGARIDIRAVAGPAPPGLASLFSIYDARQREVLLVGPDRDDLVLRMRRRAAAWRLDQPEIRYPDLLAGIPPGDTLLIRLWATVNERCAWVNGRSACGRMFGPASGWTLLFYPRSLPPWTHDVFGGAWILGLVVPVVFWGWHARRSGSHGERSGDLS